MRQKKSESIEEEDRKLSFQYIRKVMEINMINKQQKWGYLIQKRQLKIISQRF